jgi:hypothetical protein
MRPSSIRRRAGIAAALLLLTTTVVTAGAGAASRSHVGPSAGCTSSITTCAMNILAPAGGTHGVYLKKVGGAVLASANAAFPFEPASSIKPLIALYVLNDMKKGFTTLSTPLPEIDN